MKAWLHFAWPFVLTAPAAAQPELYFSEYQFEAASMNAVGLDGSNDRTLFMLPPEFWLPLGITFDVESGRLLWIDSAGPSDVMTAATDGSGLTSLSNPPGFARGASLDAEGRFYFSSNNQLFRTDPDGTIPVPIYTSPNTDPIGNPRVDATNGHVYVGANNEIKRFNLDGTDEKTVVRGISQPRAIGLDVGAGLIYWIDADTHSDFVGRARLDGTGYTRLIDNSPGVSGTSGLIDLLVDPASSSVIYADELLGRVYRAALDGSGPTILHSSLPNRAPSGLVLSTGEPAQALQDCDDNGIADDVDIAGGAADCDNNGVLDSCQSDPCPERVLLVDNMSNAADFQGRTVGTSSHWQVFQPFDVPFGGWDIDEIGLDGYTVEYANGTGLTARLYPDDGTLTRPDETAVLAEATLHLLYATNFENWVYAPFEATLAEGRYWVRLEANDPPAYWASINHGFQGLPSISRGQSGNFTNPAQPIALRIIDRADVGCAADWDESGVVGSADITAFLSDWFADLANGTLVADFDSSGVTGSADITAFLGAWFDALANGC